MILNKQCHLPFSLLIGNPGSPVMKVGCSPSTVWKRRKKRTCKIHFSWEELNQFFAPTYYYFPMYSENSTITLFHITRKSSYNSVILMAEFRQSSFKIIGSLIWYTLQLSSIYCKLLIKLYEYLKKLTPGYFKTSFITINYKNLINIL